MFAVVVRMRAVEEDSYFIDDNITIPVTDILGVVEAPPRLLRRTADSTLLPLTSSVRCSVFDTTIVIVLYIGIQQLYSFPSIKKYCWTNTCRCCAHYFVFG